MMKEFKIEYVKTVVEKYEIFVTAENEEVAQEKVELDLHTMGSLSERYTDYIEVTEVEEV